MRAVGYRSFLRAGGGGCKLWLAASTQAMSEAHGRGRVDTSRGGSSWLHGVLTRKYARVLVRVNLLCQCARVLTAVRRSVAIQIFNVLDTLGPPRPPPMPAFNASIFASQLKVRPYAL